MTLQNSLSRFYFTLAFTFVVYAHSAFSEERTAVDQPKVTGKVTDVDTGKPVPGAEVSILLKDEQDPSKRLVFGITNDEGIYEINVPLGQCQIWFPKLKPGFWLDPSTSMRMLVTSRESPTVVSDLQVNRGAVWNVRVSGGSRDPNMNYLSSSEVADDDLREKWLRGEPVQFEETPCQWIGKYKPNQISKLTEAGKSRKNLIGIGIRAGEILADTEFDNTHVVATESKGTKTGRDKEQIPVVQLTDRNGNHATISGFAIALKDEQPILIAHQKTRDILGTQVIKGRIVDTNSNPIAGAVIQLARGTKNHGSAMQGTKTETDKEGIFQFDIEQYEFEPDRQYSVAVFSNGYAAQDSPWKQINAEYQPIDFGDLGLDIGYAAKFEVTTSDGKPAAGAIIEPSGHGYALRGLATRTDSKGCAVIESLPKQTLRVSVSLGKQQRTVRVNVDEDSGKTPLIVRLQPEPPKNFVKPKPLPLGTIAPELSGDLWSDAKSIPSQTQKEIFCSSTFGIHHQKFVTRLQKPCRRLHRFLSQKESSSFAFMSLGAHRKQSRESKIEPSGPCRRQSIREPHCSMERRLKRTASSLSQRLLSLIRTEKSPTAATSRPKTPCRRKLECGQHSIDTTSNLLEKACHKKSLRHSTKK